MNNTTINITTNEYLAVSIILNVFLILSVFGNSLLVIAIIRDKQLRSTTNYFVANLALCDMVNMIFIPFTMEWNRKFIRGESFPYGAVGCKAMVPVNTYIKTTGVFSLVCIAIEGYRAILYINATSSKQRTIVMIMLIHSLGIIIASPTFYYWRLVLRDGFWVCQEEMERNAAYQYTISLFMFQYLLPLFVIAILYSSAWYKLNKRNNKMIKMSEEYEKKMQWSSQGNESPTTSEYSRLIGSHYSPAAQKRLRSDSRLSNTSVISKLSRSTITERISRISKSSVADVLRLRSRKSSFISETALVRHRQTKRTLKMFVVVVCVFAILQLPNQIIWLASINTFNYVLYIFLVLTYVSPVVNCWIYGVCNKRFRRAYMSVIRTVFCRKSYTLNEELSTATPSKLSRTSSCHENKRRQEIEERQTQFTSMFEHHKNNFDQYKHLYGLEEEEETKPPPQKPRRKITIANFFQSLKVPTAGTQPQDNIKAPACPKVKPKRKMTIDNLLNSFKESPGTRRGCMLPPLIESLAESDENIESSVNNISTSADTVFEGVQRKRSIWTRIPTLFKRESIAISNNSLKPTNSRSRLSDVKPHDSMCDSETDESTSNITDSFCSIDEYVIRQNQKEEKAYSNTMKRKCKQRKDNAVDEDGRHKFTHATQSNANDVKIFYPERTRSTSLSDLPKVVLEQTERRRKSISTLTMMDFNIKLSNMPLNRVDYASFSIPQIRRDDSKEYHPIEEETLSSIPTSVVKKQPPRDTDNETRSPTSPRRRKNASPALQCAMLYVKNSDDNCSMQCIIESAEESSCREQDKTGFAHIDETQNVMISEENCSSSRKKSVADIVNPTTNCANPVKTDCFKLLSYSRTLGDIEAFDTSASSASTSTSYQSTGSSSNSTHSIHNISTPCLSKDTASTTSETHENIVHNTHVKEQAQYNLGCNSVKTDFFYKDMSNDQWISSKSMDHAVTVREENKLNNTCDFTNTNMKIQIVLPTTQKFSKRNKTYKDIISKCFARGESDSVDDVVLQGMKIDLSSPTYTRRTKLTEHVNSRLADMKANDVVNA